MIVFCSAVVSFTLDSDFDFPSPISVSCFCSSVMTAVDLNRDHLTCESHLSPPPQPESLELFVPVRSTI